MTDTTTPFPFYGDGLPEDLQHLLTKSFKSQPLKTWQVKEESGDVTFKLVFKNKTEDSGTESSENKNATTSGAVIIPEKLACVSDYKDHCKLHMPKDAFTYFSRPAMPESTKDRNKEAFSEIEILPEQLKYANVDLSHTLSATDQEIQMPIAIAPTAFHGWVTPEGELATVAAAKLAGVVYVSSMNSNTKLEDISAAEPEAMRWQEIRMFKDKDANLEFMRRAEEAGVTAIVLNIDEPTQSVSWDREQALDKTPDLGIPNYSDSKLPEYNQEQSWEDIAWFIEESNLPVILKGIMSPDDAKRAVNVEAKGIIISNNGGRTLDCLQSPLDVLPEIVQAAREAAKKASLWDSMSRGYINDGIYVEAGIQSGVDVFKALASGANMVFIGRAAIWGLAQGGQAGLSNVLDILKEELLTIMKVAGTPTLEDIDSDKINNVGFNRYLKTNDFQFSAIAEAVFR